MNLEFIDVYTEPSAIEVLWDILGERSAENDPSVNISHRALPAYADHVKFVESRPYRYWYLLRNHDQWLGYVYITSRDEIGIQLYIEARGAGYGDAALTGLLKMHKPEMGHQFLANINPRNARSISLFARHGFLHVQDTYALERS